MNHSAQRQAILAQLRSVTCHPTADELHAMLRGTMPQLSLGTVYRNLDLLTRNGMVLALHTAGAQKRFDGNTELHHHMRCESCDRVFDLHSLEHAGELEMVLQKILRATRCHAYHLEMTGVCDSCKNQ